MKFQSQILSIISACSVFSNAFTPYPSFRIHPLRKVGGLKGSNFGDGGGGFGDDDGGFGGGGFGDDDGGFGDDDGGFGGGGFGNDGGGVLDGPPLPGQGGGGFGGNSGFGSSSLGGPPLLGQGPPLPGQGGNSNGFGGSGPSGPPLPGQGNSDLFGGSGNSGSFGGGGIGSSNGFGGGMSSSSGPPLPGQSSNNGFGGSGTISTGGFGSSAMGSSNNGFDNQNNQVGFQPQMQRSPKSQGGMKSQFRERSGSLGMDKSPMGGSGMQLENRNNNNYNTMKLSSNNVMDRTDNQFMRNTDIDYYFDALRDTREMMDDIEKIVVQGNARKTCSFDENVRRVGILMHTEGRPLNATVDLWQGPDNAPQQMQVYLEEGWKRPFRAIMETPGSSNSVSFKNRNPLEYPLLVGMDVDRTGEEHIPSVENEYVIVQGGGVHSLEFKPEVEAVQVSFTSDGRPMSARLELLQGPSNTKQLMDMYCENGIERPFNIIIETPGPGNVVRAVNLAPLEFPLMVSSQPFRFQDYPRFDDGIVTWNTLGKEMQVPADLSAQQSTQSAFGLNGGNDSIMSFTNSQGFGSN